MGVWIGDLRLLDVLYFHVLFECANYAHCSSSGRLLDLPGVVLSRPCVDISRDVGYVRRLLLYISGRCIG